MKTFVLIVVLIGGIIPIETFADEVDDIIPCIIQVESGGNPNAVGASGEIGLMQISPVVLKEYNNEVDKGNIRFGLHNRGYCFAELYNPVTNVKIGDWYLRRLKDHYLKDVDIKAFSFTGYCINNYYGKKIDLSNWKDCFATYDKDGIMRLKLMLILSAYNGGITRLRKNNYNINKMPKSTQRYIKKIMRLYAEKEDTKR